MMRYAYPLIFLIIAFPIGAQIQSSPHKLQVVADPAMLVLDRGARLEVIPAKRAIPKHQGSGRLVVHKVINASPGDGIGAARLGVVFNHAMQQQGYISGEITFKLKAGTSAAGIRAVGYPGLKKITSPEVYVVNARNPAEFIRVLKELQARADLEWVEPTVVYGPAAK